MTLGPHNLYNGMRVVAYVMEKGGTGKTTLGLHHAIRAASGYIPEVKRKVLFVDTDQQQNSSKCLLRMETVQGEGFSLPPIHPDFDPNDPEDIEWGGRSNSVDLYYGNAVLPYPSEINPERLDVLPSDGVVLKGFEKSENAEQSLLDQIYEQFHIFCSLPEVQEEYDLIIFDCPPGKTLITTPVIRAATDIILPAQPEVFGLDGIQRMIWEIKKENKFRKCDANIVGVIPNQIDGRLKKHEKNLKELRADPEIGPYVMDYELHRLSAMSFEKLPTAPVKDPRIKDPNSEAQVMKFINSIREKMYGVNVDMVANG